MKHVDKKQAGRLWPALMIGFMVASTSEAATTPAPTWASVTIPKCFAAWTIVRAPYGVYVGGSGTDLSPGVWRYRNHHWSRIFNSKELVGSVNALTADSQGYVDVALFGTTYKWRSEIQQFDPRSDAWGLRAVGNLASYSSIKAADNTLLAAGARLEPIPQLPVIASLDVFIGKTRFTPYLETARNFNAVTSDPTLGIHVSGVYGNDSSGIPDEKTGKPGFWYYDGFKFDAIQLPVEVAEIDTMQGDGKGTIFIAGRNPNNQGRVWAYKDQRFSDTGLRASEIKALASDDKGRIYAGGISAKLQGQVWLYVAKTKTWSSLGLRKSDLVRALHASESAVYAVGADENSKAKLWIYQ